MTEPNTKLIIRIVLVVVLIASSVGLFFWLDYSKKRAADAQILSELKVLQSGLTLYYRDHAAFPPAGPEGARLIGPGGLTCLAEGGFLAECPKQDVYDRIVPGPFEYRSLALDDSKCVERVGCPRYEVVFELLTNAAYPKGEHRLTPEGVR